MLRRSLVHHALLLAALIFPGATAFANGPTPEQIEEAIAKGLVWLVQQQNLSDGGWYGYPSYSPGRVAATGLAVLKLEARAIEKGMDPLDPVYEYSENVQRGLDFITSTVTPANLYYEPVNPGEPDGNGNGKRAYFRDADAYQVYETGIAMMALAASGHPETYQDILQDALDFMAFAQVSSPSCGFNVGGWYYEAVSGCTSTDNSNSGYATLGLGFAAGKAPWGFGLTIPQATKDRLSSWIDVMQDPVDGDANDGGSYYQPSSRWWVNILKTGNLLYEMALVGDDLESQRVQNAIHYVERNWTAPGYCDVGWKNHRQAMFAMMKGLEVFGIEKLDLDGDGTPEADWFAQVAQHLIETQNSNGSWPYDCWAGEVMSTAWALLTLERVVQAREIPVPVDIKPTSCPNPINTKSQGVLPVAILGTAEFDVTQIDPATIRLTNPVLPQTIVALPLRWAFEDVATPYEPYLGKKGMYDCNTLGPDGRLDLTLKFDSQAVVPVLGSVADGQVVVLQVRGNLKKDFGGTAFVGEDVVRVLVKQK